MNTLEIIKASAGSGKTWTLAREYINLLVPADGQPFDPQAFRHILAVTFTNKATEEMKSRIIEELHKLATVPDYPYPAPGQHPTPLMRKRAALALTAILHDYASFSVSTIDRFFQTVLRAFAREINQYASYKVELDRNAVLQQAVDRMLASLDEAGSADLLKWLTDYSIGQISNGKQWDISAPLFEICGLLTDEEFLRLRRQFGAHLWDRETIARFQLKLEGIISSKESKDKIKTAKQLRENIWLLGIVSDLYYHLTSLLKENNLVLLSETTDVLSRIIDGSDTPFIYEKVGTRYDHFMLDEFQDTSRLQWENLRPLLKDGIDRAESSLVVGDIKQSIYRWRGSDLRLLHSEVGKLLPDPAEHIHSKQGNWRSTETVIRFNNAFFERIGDWVEKLDKTRPFAPAIRDYYSDVAQTVARSSNRSAGYVRVEFFDRGDKKEGTAWDDQVLERLPAFMEELSQRYPRYSDIAFLVRTNEEGGKIAERLLSLGYPVVTEDSLALGSCLSVKRLAALLTFLCDPSNSVNLTLMQGLFDTIPQLSRAAGDSDSLYEICDSLLRNYLPEIPAGDQPFLFAFLDEVIAYTDKFGSNLPGFVEWWKRTGATKKISAPKRDDAVTVMTIHKAKGLDFEVVVLPFFDESLSAGNPILWCEPEGDFAEIQLVPLKSKEDLAATEFRDAYEEEKKMQCLDAINTAYVAMTRAVQEMYLFAPVPRYQGDKLHAGGNAVSTLLYFHLFPDHRNEPDVAEFGLKSCGIPPKTSGESLPPVAYRSAPYGDRLRLSLKGGDDDERAEGVRRHEILSRIDTVEDLPRALQSALGDGLISAAELPQVQAEFERLLASVAGRHWFDGTYRPLNEITVVDEQGEIHRPDRVLVEKDKPLGQGTALVIDYKFGARREAYRRQIRRYMKLLSQMGYHDVRGTLWYCHETAEDVD
jgi:ATP-dependent exoDNAse (exonuclease V) beta subunit